MAWRAGLALLALAPLPAQGAVPATLDCVAHHHFNWQHAAPVLLDDSDKSPGEPGRFTIHLDPNSGEWFLAYSGSAALTQGGGTFTVVRESSFEKYYDEWVGTDGDTMLRIAGGSDLRFVFVADGVSSGVCSEPAEPFVFLRDRSPA